MTNAVNWLGKAVLLVCSLAGAVLAGELVLRSSARVRPRFTEEMSCRRRDALLGGGYKPDCSARWRKWRIDGDGKHPIWDIRFTTDQWGHRVTPNSPGSDRPDQVVFFGCSFTVGAGLNDDETLPYYFSQHAPQLAVHDFAASGFGPQQMLAILTETDARPLRPTPGRMIGVYVFLDGHIARVIGKYSEQKYARYFPYYHFARDGTLVHTGSFATGRPWRTRMYDFVESSGLSFLEAFLLAQSHHVSPAEDELTAAIIRRSADAFRERFGGDEFYVVVYPGNTEEMYGPVAARLRQMGITVLDYAHLVDMRADGAHIPVDGHPTAQTQRVVAEQLARDIAALPGRGYTVK
jgi:hypothetical protein